MLSPIEAFSGCERISLESFYGHFTAASRSVFRLEALESYLVPEEQGEIEAFQKGQDEPPPGTSEKWHNLIRASTSKGVKWHRLRLIKEPVSLYIRYEIAWGYRYSVPAGEPVSVLRFSEFPSLKTSPPIFKDYWLFDESVLIFLEYDLHGKFLGLLKAPSVLAPCYVELREELLNISAPIQTDKDLWRIPN